MYIANWPLRKIHWEPFFDCIVEGFADGDYTRIPGTDVYRIDKLYGDAVYTAAKMCGDEFHIYGWFYLKKKTELKAWEIHQSYIFPAHRRQGWSTAIHRAIIEKEGLLLASGSQQTKAAREMWKRMVAQGKYHILAYDFKKKDVSDVVYDPHKDRVVCNFQVYDSYFNSSMPNRDVRFLAIRKE